MVNMLRNKLWNTESRPGWFINILLAIIIYTNAEAGRFLGLHELPLSISVVWPATGFALAAILLFGCGAWPGIFLGNFCYNALHLYLNGTSFFAPICTATLITLGSTLQALVSGFIMKSFVSKGYFETVRDTVIFLIPAGILSCLIAPTIGVTALYIYGVLPPHSEFHVWLTFWIGDTLGVYILTPILVVWSLYKPKVSIKAYPWELFFITVAFIILSLVSLTGNMPIAELFIPLIFWVAYRFRRHGVTIVLILFALMSIIPASVGHGSFVKNLISNQLIVLVSFLEVVIATGLLIAALCEEYENKPREIIRK